MRTIIKKINKNCRHSPLVGNKKESVMFGEDLKYVFSGCAECVTEMIKAYKAGKNPDITRENKNFNC